MTKIVSVILTVVFGVLLVSIVVNAATTISTNISTGGTLSVTGLSSLGQASTTMLSVHGGTAYFGGTATSTFNTAGLGTFQGYVSQASSTVVGTLTVTGDTTFGGGSGAITVTTTNAATSTITIGCIQTTATSTDTPVRFVLSSAASTTATFGAGTANGGVSWQYGTCPI